MADLAKIAEDLSTLTVMDAAALVKMLEEKWGVKAASGGGGAVVVGTVAPPVEVVKKTEFTVVLVDAGAEKIKVIKEIRAITSLGLKEAKDLVDGAPKNVKEDVPEEEAKKIKAILEGVGAKVDLK